MRIIKFSIRVAILVILVTVFGTTLTSAQQKHPEKKTEEKMKPAIPVKKTSEVAKDSTVTKKSTDGKMKKMMPKAKPPGK